MLDLGPHAGFIWISYGAAVLVKRESEPPLWRVLVGKDLSEDSAAQLAEKIRAEHGPAFVVRLDDVPAPDSQ